MSRQAIVTLKRTGHCAQVLHGSVRVQLDRRAELRCGGTLVTRGARILRKFTRARTSRLVVACVRRAAGLSQFEAPELLRCLSRRVGRRMLRRAAGHREHARSMRPRTSGRCEADRAFALRSQFTGTWLQRAGLRTLPGAADAGAGRGPVVELIARLRVRGGSDRSSRCWCLCRDRRCLNDRPAAAAGWIRGTSPVIPYRSAALPYGPDSPTSLVSYGMRDLA